MWSLSLRNFHVLQTCDIRLSPGYVYALIGRNGSGKTTLLNAFLWAHQNSNHMYEGVSVSTPLGFVNQPYDPSTPFEAALTMGDGMLRFIRTDRYTMQMDLLAPGGQVVLPNTSFLALRERPEVQQALRLFQASTFNTRHLQFQLDNLRDVFSKLPKILQEEIVAETEKAFPKEVFDLASENGLRLFALHLIELVRAPAGTILSFEAPEHGLHPAAIRSLFELCHHHARQKNLTILLVTQSPSLLREYNDHPEEVLVVSPTKTIPVTGIRQPQWLRHFSLGDLYDRQEFDL